VITYTNIQRHDNLDFDQYLKLPGYSHSFLKSNVNGVRKHFDVTENVRVGAIVDGILTDPTRVDMSDPLYPECKALAHELMKVYGDAINLFEKQVSYTATMEMQGLSMPVTGRLDFLLPGHAVIDLKVTFATEVDALIDFMGYGNQLWHYCRMAKVPKAYLMICQVKKKKLPNGKLINNPKIFLKEVDVSNDTNSFWISKLLDFGNATGSDVDGNKLIPGLIF